MDEEGIFLMVSELNFFECLHEMYKWENEEIQILSI